MRASQAITEWLEENGYKSFDFGKVTFSSNATCDYIKVTNLEDGVLPGLGDYSVLISISTEQSLVLISSYTGDKTHNIGWLSDPSFFNNLENALKRFNMEPINEPSRTP